MRDAYEQAAPDEATAWPLAAPSLTSTTRERCDGRSGSITTTARENSSLTWGKGPLSSNPLKSL
jgi:hypothetical protein